MKNVERNKWKMIISRGNSLVEKLFYCVSRVMDQIERNQRPVSWIYPETFRLYGSFSYLFPTEWKQQYQTKVKPIFWSIYFRVLFRLGWRLFSCGSFTTQVPICGVLTRVFSPSLILC